jgi:hypothetical protein
MINNVENAQKTVDRLTQSHRELLAKDAIERAELSFVKPKIYRLIDSGSSRFANN